MPNFAYKALDQAGRSKSGDVAAANRSAALDMLSNQGLVPVRVDERQAAEAVARPVASAGGKVKAHLAESFIRELSNLLAGGVSLSRALQILSRETSSPAAKRQWTAIHDDVVGGQSLAEALGRWPGTFSPVQVAMVRGYAKHFRLEAPADEIEREALEWATTRGSRSGRAAWQFTQDLAGRLGRRLDGEAG